MVVKEIKNDGIRHLLKGGSIQRFIFLNGLKCVVNSTDRINSGLFCDDIRWRRKLMIRVHRSHSDRLNAKLTQSANIVDGHRLSLDQITSSGGIEQALSKNHTVL